MKQKFDPVHYMIGFLGQIYPTSERLAGSGRSNSYLARTTDYIQGTADLMNNQLACARMCMYTHTSIFSVMFKLILCGTSNNWTLRRKTKVSQKRKKTEKYLR